MGRSATYVSTWFKSCCYARRLTTKILLLGWWERIDPFLFRHGSLFLLNPLFFLVHSFLSFFSCDSWGENKSRRHERINRPTAATTPQTGHKPPTETNGGTKAKKRQSDKIVNFLRVGWGGHFSCFWPTSARTRCWTLLNSPSPANCVLWNRKKRF